MISPLTIVKQILYSMFVAFIHAGHAPLVNHVRNVGHGFQAMDSPLVAADRYLTVLTE